MVERQAQIMPRREQDGKVVKTGSAANGTRSWLFMENQQRPRTRSQDRLSILLFQELQTDVVLVVIKRTREIADTQGDTADVWRFHCDNPHASIRRRQERGQIKREKG